MIRRTFLSSLCILASFCFLTPSVYAQEPEAIPAGVAPPPGPYAPGVDVVHYEVEVGLGLGILWFEGITTISVSVEASAPMLPLDFTGLAINSVSMAGAETSYTHEEGVLRVPLAGYSSGDTVDVTIHYEGVPDDGLIIRENMHGDPVAFVDNWPNRARFWLPSLDHPADKATVRYTVHAPTEWKVIANGHLTADAHPSPQNAIGPEGDRHTWTWEVGVPISPYNMAIGAADFEVRTVGLAACGNAPASHRDDGCVEVTYWVFPQDVENAARSFRRAAEMVDHFTDVVGPFPFEKLANVQSVTRFGGMENASAIFYSEQSIASGRDIEGTVSHEIAHQWFGDAITEANWHHLWLSEGFATYFGAQFFEANDGVEDFRQRMEQSRQRILQPGEADRPIYDPTETDLFALLNTNNYPKGAWVLHMLRGIVGDDDFLAGIKEYYRKHLHSAVLTEDFRAVMEEVSGRDLEWFFRQWIYEPGYPTLEVTQSWTPNPNGSEGTTEITIRQVQSDDWPTFRLPIEILLVVGDRELLSDIEIFERETVIRMDGMTSEPTKIVLDPNGWVLKGVT